MMLNVYLTESCQHSSLPSVLFTLNTEKYRMGKRKDLLTHAILKGKGLGGLYKLEVITVFIHFEKCVENTDVDKKF